MLSGLKGTIGAIFLEYLNLPNYSLLSVKQNLEKIIFKLFIADIYILKNTEVII